MKNNLVTRNKDSKLALNKTKSLLSLTNKILANKKNELVDESWIERLWAWADENNVDAETIPRDKKELLNLTELYLGGHELKELPKEIGNLTNLTGFYLKWNELKELPKEVGNLTNLTKLDLEMNELKELPKEIGNLTNLTELTLWDNELEELPKEIGNFTNLTTLDLSDNELKELPKEIGELANLSTLYLRGNPSLILTEEQKGWIRELKYNACDVGIDDYLLDINDDEIPF